MHKYCWVYTKLSSVDRSLARSLIFCLILILCIFLQIKHIGIFRTAAFCLSYTERETNCIMYTLWIYFVHIWSLLLCESVAYKSRLKRNHFILFSLFFTHPFSLSICNCLELFFYSFSLFCAAFLYHRSKFWYKHLFVHIGCIFLTLTVAVRLTKNQRSWLWICWIRWQFDKQIFVDERDIHYESQPKQNLNQHTKKE